MNFLELLVELIFTLVANGTIFCLLFADWVRRVVVHIPLLPIYAIEITLELLFLAADRYWPPPPPPTPCPWITWPDDAIPPPSFTDPKNHDIAPLWYLRELERRKAEAAAAVARPAPPPRQPSLPLHRRLFALVTGLLAGLTALVFGFGNIFVGFGHLVTASRHLLSASATTSRPDTGNAGQLALDGWSSDSLTKLHEIIEDQELEGSVPPEFGRLQVSIEAVLKGRGVEV